MLLVASASDLPRIYHRNANKSPFYVNMQLGTAPSVFHSISHLEHAKHRKLIAPSYSFSSIKQYEPEIDLTISLWLNQLHENFSSKECRAETSFDFSLWAAYLCYQNMGNFAFTTDFKMRRADFVIEPLRKTLRKWLVTFGFFSRLHPLVSWMKQTFIGSLVRYYGPRYGGTLGASQRLRNELLQDRLDSDAKNSKKHDLMQRSVLSENKPQPISPRSIRLVSSTLEGLSMSHSRQSSFVLNFLLLYLREPIPLRLGSVPLSFILSPKRLIHYQGSWMRYTLVESGQSLVSAPVS